MVEMAVVEASPEVTGGVDTHLDSHVAAALDPIGGLLGVESFPATPAGYRSLVAWMGGFGPVARVGVEGTGSYGAGVGRFLHRAGVGGLEGGRGDPPARPGARVGVEGTGSYGAGLARFLHRAGVAVIEVDRANRQARRAVGKSDPADALEAGPGRHGGGGR